MSTSQMDSSLSVTKEDSSVSLILESSHPRLAYYARNWDKKKSIRHWGQRKLLLSEILFLTRWGHLSDLVVYAGAAPGQHIPYLSQLFPQHQFVLVDPNPFAVKPTDKITIMNRYFTDELAHCFSDRRVLFISDIRTADYRQMTPIENETLIIKDNQSQISWVKIMKPAKSMLKFRCPYPSVITEPCKMFKGTIFFQVWPPPSSTETRLVVDDSLDIVDYDNRTYEEMLFYHNEITRFQKYPHSIEAPGLDCSYDAKAEIEILSEYLQIIKKLSPTDAQFQKIIADMSTDMSKSISHTGRTLLTMCKNPSYRRNFPSVNHRVFYEIKTEPNAV